MQNVELTENYKNGLKYPVGYAIIKTSRGTNNTKTPTRKENKMERIAITAKEAYKLAKELGICISEDGTTFYATNKARTELWEFDTKKERDTAVRRQGERK